MRLGLGFGQAYAHKANPNLVRQPEDTEQVEELACHVAHGGAVLVDGQHLEGQAPVGLLAVCTRQSRRESGA